MQKRTEKMLKILSDQKWHVYNKLPKNIGAMTVVTCIQEGFIRTKMVDRKLKNGLHTHRTALHITRRGRLALQEAK